MPRSNRSARAAVTRPVLALFLLGQWLFLLAFASSEKLHHAICDGKQPTHDCAFATVAKSQLLSMAEPVQAPLPQRLADTRSIHRAFTLPSTEDFRLTPSRGPPVDILPT